MDLLCNMVKKRILINLPFIVIGPIAQWTRGDLNRGRTFADRCEECNSILWYCVFMFFPHVSGKGVFGAKLFVISAGKADPIFKTGMFC